MLAFASVPRYPEGPVQPGADALGVPHTAPHVNKKSLPDRESERRGRSRSGRCGAFPRVVSREHNRADLLDLRHPLHTRFANIFGTSISETTMRPNLTPAAEVAGCACRNDWAPSKVLVKK